MLGRFFIDTNIFISAHDSGDKAKTQTARELIVEAHESGQGKISEQIIREFCNVAVKKFNKRITTTDVIDIVRVELRPLLIESDGGDLYERALKLKDRYSLSFYDALVAQAALSAGCEVLYSENIQAGLKIRGLTVVNPFV